MDCSPSLSPIGRVCSDVSDSTDSLGVEVLVSPLIDSSSDVALAVNHAGLPLPSMDNIFVQDMLWAPAAPQDPRPNDDGVIPVPRWRLAREGPFLAERSPESISFHWGPVGHSEIRPITPRTTPRHWGTTDYLCITRGSSKGSGFPNRPDSSTLVVHSGQQTLTGPGRCCGRTSTARRWIDANQRGCPGPVRAIAPEDGVQDDITLSGLP